MISRVVRGPLGTVRLAHQLAASLRGGELIRLVGPVGAGKTTFVRGLAHALGIRGDVRSPSFTLLRPYRVVRRTFRWLVHVDGYRLARLSDLRQIGIDDWLGRPSAVVVVEWPPRGLALATGPSIHMTIRPLGRSRRVVEIVDERGPATTSRGRARPTFPEIARAKRRSGPRHRRPSSPQ